VTRGNEVCGILVGRPSLPEARGLRTPALGVGRDQCDRFPDARSATALLMLPRGEVPVQMDNVGRPQPVVLDPAEPAPERWAGWRLMPSPSSEEYTRLPERTEHCQTV
jgi:hypothetical protein